MKVCRNCGNEIGRSLPDGAVSVVARKKLLGVLPWSRTKHYCDVECAEADAN